MRTVSSTSAAGPTASARTDRTELGGRRLSKLGISLDPVRSSLSLLEASGQARKTRHGWAPRQHAVIDTGADPGRARALELEWARLALERLSSGAPGHCGYSLFAISREGLQRLREVQLAYVREMQSIIARSGGEDCVALYCAQLIDLAVPESNAFRSRSARDE